MSNLPFLDNYSGEKLETLLDNEGKYRTDSLILALEQAIHRKRTGKGDASLSDHEVTVLSVCALEREVNNGGYEQFFLNSSNAFLDRIVEDLKRAGCETVARITKSAIDALEVESFEAETVAERVAQDDDALFARLEACDAEYYRTDHQVEVRLFEFVKANRASFSIPIAARIAAWVESKIHSS